MTNDQLRVAVLAGGDSAEREISLASGRRVLDALSQRGHDVEWFDPARRDLARIPWGHFDLAFIALHGGAGEDGRVQARLEAWGVPFTGSGSLAASRAMSKTAAKARLRAAGVPTLPCVRFEADDPLADIVVRVAEMGYPAVVKPDAQGSSLGVGFAGDAGELAARLAAARRYGALTLAEPWIDGREFTVAMLGHEPLPILEIVTPRGLFDFEAKYRSTATEYRFDTGLPPEIADRVRSAASAAVAALGTEGLARVDLMLSRAGDPWVLEVNTVPGMTDHSLAPLAAERAGLAFSEVCDWMLQDALRRGRHTPVSAVPG
ncbi:MAG TPA: D-alanine--D-alanine ligase [Pirellulales bacterium]|nr:D-alanine--D-alanine ligase [Pirellulales bacterium]